MNPQFFRRPVRIAAGDQDARLGILPVNPVNALANIVIRGSGHCASIQDHEVGALRLAGFGQPLPFKQALQRGAVSLRRPAPEVLYEEPPHPYS